MLVGLFLRNIKVYKGQHYVPMSDGQSFSALIGPNGVGKSSVLEAIDLILNGRDFAEWNINKDSSGGATGSSFPFVTLVLLVRKSMLEPENVKDLQVMSDELWENNEPGIKVAPAAQAFLEHRERLAPKYRNDDWLLVFVGRKYQDSKAFYFSSFHNSIKKRFDAPARADEDEIESNFQLQLREPLNNILERIEYFYLPVETDARLYTKLETIDMQRLIGGDIQKKIADAIGDTAIDEINRRLDDFLKALGTTLVDYHYQAPGRKQSLTKRDLISKIIEAYFSIKTLHKKRGAKPLPVSELSAGQKRRSLVDVAYAFLTTKDKPNRDVIFAIDEPDASLDRDSCFEQFERLFEIASAGHQVVAATHWYGFLPIVHDGVAQSLGFNSEAEPRQAETFDLYSYPESVRIAQKRSRNELPHDVALKSHNDLVQSITSSILKPENGYKWVICEGTSDKLYLDYYLQPLLAKQRLRIIPVAGRDEVRRVFEHLVTSLKDRAKNANGRILCLVDTDATSIEVGLSPIERTVEFRRLLLGGNGEIDLVSINSNSVAPETAIEDCLPASIFIEVARSFEIECPELKPILDSIDKDSTAKYSGALDLRKSHRDFLRKKFFGGGNGETKVKFARHLVQIASSDPALSQPPEWVSQIAEFLKRGKWG